MKKAIAIILAVMTIFALIALLTSCGHAERSTDGHGKRFVKIEDNQVGSVYVDTETGVEWLLHGHTFTPIIDSYGKPYTYPAFDAREDAQ